MLEDTNSLDGAHLIYKTVHQRLTNSVFASGKFAGELISAIGPTGKNLFFQC